MGLSTRTGLTGATWATRRPRFSSPQYGQHSHLALQEVVDARPFSASLCPPSAARSSATRVKFFAEAKNWRPNDTNSYVWVTYRLAERVGFEPTCRLRDKTLSRRPRYDHFGTSPRCATGRTAISVDRRTRHYNPPNLPSTAGGPSEARRLPLKNSWMRSRAAASSTPPVTANR